MKGSIRTLSPASPPPERTAGLVMLPVMGTLLFYAAPPSVQNHLAAQFTPQALSYLGFILWSAVNGRVVQRLGLGVERLAAGLAWGTAVGVALGGLNLFVILKAAPWLGYDIHFLAETPHARVPVWIMVPWLVCAIAILVELNFRGFVLGRLLALSVPRAAAVLLSAVLFAFDPFLLCTFRQLHWIAVWDGIIWGIMWIRLGNLYATITAHAVEVIILYCIVRVALS